MMIFAFLSFLTFFIIAADITVKASTVSTFFILKEIFILWIQNKMLCRG